ncbi:ICOS ligand isoform X1 [Prionailurus viverrinus]|uniref:ICOS ligand isoform X1 n=1 Tax=Prionailurus viverrinus TaxID=61388 RepID=UPI001FF4E980|nr:ICOS ligand isoform X1 [Prionailurus viverrinus]
MRLTSAGMFLLLFSALQANVQEKEVRALVGSDVELSCIFPERHSFDLNDLYVYWQTSVVGTPKTVVTYYLSGNSSAGHEDNRYRDRARLSLESMKRGDFSLHLHNITPQDEQRFNCLVFRKSLELEKILDVVVTLHVAANYSMPVVRAPSGPSENEELTFTCTSMNGYPRPNVYWINRTDNSLLNETLQNNTVSLNAQGLYDVVSVLTIRRTPSVNVGCCIENVLLHQNLTTISTQAGGLCASHPALPRWRRLERAGVPGREKVEFRPSPPEEPQILNVTKQSQGSSEASVPPSVFSCSGWKGSLPFPPHPFSLVLFSSPVETVTGTEYGITESQADAPKKQGAVLSALIVLGVVVAVAVATGWVCRSRCPPRDPRRSWAARPEQTFSSTVSDENSPPGAWTGFL